MTQDEIIEMAKEAFIKRGFWPNEVMWKCWLDSWILSAQHERKACLALHDHEDVLSPVGASAWGEAYQCGWEEGTEAYRDAIQARGQA